MAKPYAIVLVAVWLLATEWSCTSSPASVNIYNFIDKGEILEVYCGRFPGKVVNYGEHFGWGFSPSVWGTTRYSCGFQWGRKVQLFVVWVDDDIIIPVPFRPCVHCVWRVGREGFYLAQNGKAPELYHPCLGGSELSSSLAPVAPVAP